MPYPEDPYDHHAALTAHADIRAMLGRADTFTIPTTVVTPVLDLMRDALDFISDGRPEPAPQPRCDSAVFYLWNDRIEMSCSTCDFKHSFPNDPSWRLLVDGEEAHQAHFRTRILPQHALIERFAAALREVDTERLRAEHGPGGVWQRYEDLSPELAETYRIAARSAIAAITTAGDDQ